MEFATRRDGGDSAASFSMRPSHVSSFWSGLLFSVAAGVSAFAHNLPPGMEEVDGFADHASFLLGFNHPLGGLDHMVAALLAEAVAARLARAGRRALSGSVAALVAGGTAGGFGPIRPTTSLSLAARPARYLWPRPSWRAV